MTLLLLALCGIAATISMMWLSYKANAASVAHQATGDAILNEVADLATATKRIRTTLEELKPLLGYDHVLEFISKNLGDGSRFFNTFRLTHHELSANVLIAELQAQGYEITREWRQQSDYSSPKLFLVLAKTMEDFTSPEVAVSTFVLSAETEKVPLEGCESTAFKSADWQDADGTMHVLSAVNAYLPADCEGACQMTFLPDVQKAVVKAEMRTRPVRRKVNTEAPAYIYDGATQQKFVLDPIRMHKEQPALNLAYPAISNKNKQTVHLDTFLRRVVDVTLKQKFNWAMFGKAASGKSSILRLLAARAAESQIVVVKATAESFRQMMSDSTARTRLLALGDRILVIIDEASGLNEEQTKALLSATEGLNDSDRVSIVLCTNSEENMGGTHTDALLRTGRIGAILHINELEPAQWKPLLTELKKVYPEKTWEAPSEEKPMLLGEVYALGKDPAAEDILAEAYSDPK